MVIQKVYYMEETQEIILRHKCGSVLKALIAFNDGDCIELCDPNDALAEYDKISSSLEDEPLEFVEKKSCPLCGEKGEVYFKIDDKIYHPCRKCAERLMELYFKRTCYDSSIQDCFDT